MKNSRQITPAEFQILEVLWKRGQAQSVGQVLEALRRRRDLAYTTVMTLLDKLARKGSVVRHKRGKAYLYRPAVERVEVLNCLIQEFANNYCGGEQSQLVQAVREWRLGPDSPTPAAKPRSVERRADTRSRPATESDPSLDVVLL